MARQKSYRGFAVAASAIKSTHAAVSLADCSWRRRGWCSDAFFDPHLVLTPTRQPTAARTPSSGSSTTAAVELKRRLRTGMASDWPVLERRIDRWAHTRATDGVEGATLERLVQESVDHAKRRAAARPVVTYPPDLPV